MDKLRVDSYTDPLVLWMEQGVEDAESDALYQDFERALEFIDPVLAAHGGPETPRSVCKTRLLSDAQELYMHALYTMGDIGVNRVLETRTVHDMASHVRAAIAELYDTNSGYFAGDAHRMAQALHYSGSGFMGAWLDRWACALDMALRAHRALGTAPEWHAEADMLPGRPGTDVRAWSDNKSRERTELFMSRYGIDPEVAWQETHGKERPQWLHNYGRAEAVNEQLRAEWRYRLTRSFWLSWRSFETGAKTVELTKQRIAALGQPGQKDLEWQ